MHFTEKNTLMTTKIWLFLICITFSSIFSTVLSNNSSDDDINWWCNTTPHPEPCKYFISHSAHHVAPEQKSEFRKMMVQVAMERALHAQIHAMRLGRSCQNKKEKAAWADCLKLFDNTVVQLNRTLQGLHPNASCTNFDAQTWLSTALTNLETCRDGSLELNVSDFILPLMSNNVSELISNSLSINEGIMEEQGYKEGFPNWVSAGERKLLQSSSLAARANLVVAKDGSGNFRSIQAAIDASAKRSGSGRFVIYVKKGVYRENIEIGNNMNNIMLVGDGMRNTIISGRRSARGGYTTFNSATVGVDGLRFIARGITVQNTAGPQNGQAVALRSASDLSVFYRCAFEGYQDTLMVHSQRQFYRECYVYGTIDFIFGNAAVVLQNCIIYARRPMKGQANVITAQGRGDPNQNTGISIHNSVVMAAPDLRPVVSQFKTYLGRPWQLYSRTVYMKTYLGSLVSPKGWSSWDGTNYALNTLYYGEYKNFGPASSTKGRVKWGGYHVISNPNVASRFTVGGFIAGQSWLPSTGVPFTSGL